MKRKCEECRVEMVLLKTEDPKARKRVKCPRCGKVRGLRLLPGRPPLPDHLVKKNRTLRLSDEVWTKLGNLANGVHANGIENLLKFYEKHQNSSRPEIVEK